MTKRQEIEDPKSCLNRGPDEELKFVLREVDIVAPAVVREWCRLRCLHGKNTPKDAQITEALQWADKVQASIEKRPQSKIPLGGLTVRDIRTAYDRHFKKNGMSFDSVVQQLMGSDEIDWERFRVNHPLFCDYWDRNNWKFCTEYFLGWVNGGCCPPPPEPMKQEANTRARRIGGRER